MFDCIGPFQVINQLNRKWMGDIVTIVMASQYFFNFGLSRFILRVVNFFLQVASPLYFVQERVSFLASENFFNVDLSKPSVVKWRLMPNLNQHRSVSVKIKQNQVVFSCNLDYCSDSKSEQTAFADIVFGPWYALSYLFIDFWLHFYEIVEALHVHLSCAKRASVHVQVFPFLFLHLLILIFFFQICLFFLIGAELT